MSDTISLELNAIIGQFADSLIELHSMLEISNSYFSCDGLYESAVTEADKQFQKNTNYIYE